MIDAQFVFPLIPGQIIRLVLAVERARLSFEAYEQLVWAAYARGTGTDLPVAGRGDSRSDEAVRSRRLRQLAERGLIVRLSETPTRRRTTHVRITEDGLALLRAIRDSAATP